MEESTYKLFPRTGPALAPPTGSIRRKPVPGTSLPLELVPLQPAAAPSPGNIIDITNASREPEELVSDEAAGVLCPAPLAAPAATPKEKIIRQFPKSRPLISKLTMPKKEVLASLDDMFKWAVAKYADRPCLASRWITSRIREPTGMMGVTRNSQGEEVRSETRRKEHVIVGDWEYLSYAQVGEKVDFMARALTKLAAGGNDAGPIFMFARSTANYFMMTHAAARAGITLVGCSPKLGTKTLTRIVDETRATMVYVDGNLFEQLLTPLIECPPVTTIIYNRTTQVPEDDIKVAKDIGQFKRGLGPDIRIMSVAELISVGQQLRGIGQPAPGRDKTSDAYMDSVWMIAYPGVLNSRMHARGVIHTNRNITAIIAGMHHNMKSSILPTDTYLTHAYLYSTLEYSLVNVFLLTGVTVAFGTSTEKYLLSTPHSSLHVSCHGDLRTFQPSIFYAIMPWWTLIHKWLLQDICAHTKEYQDNFWLWFERKKWAIDNSVDFHHIMKTIDHKGGFDALRQKYLGSRIRWVANTCLWMPKERREFLGIVVGGPLGQFVHGWISTDLNMIVTFMPPREHRHDNFGQLLPSLELKLEECIDHEFKSETKVYRGIVHVRGPAVPSGFHANSEATAAAFPPDGWARTDKLGEWDAKKHEFRLIGKLDPLHFRYLGDIVPLQKVEEVYLASPLVNACCIVFLWKKVRPVAIIEIHEAALRALVAKDRTSGASDNLVPLDNLLLNPTVRARILARLLKHACEHGLVDAERIGGVVCARDGFTVENGMLGVDGRMNRRTIARQFHEEINGEWVGCERVWESHSHPRFPGRGVRNGAVGDGVVGN